MTDHAANIRQWIPDGDGYNSEYAITLSDAADRLESLENGIHEIIEIYAGMEGFIPETAPEGYQQKIIKQMFEVAKQLQEIEHERT